MQNIQMNLQEFENQAAVREKILSIGATEAGAEIMMEKAIFRILHLKNVDTKAANLLKQTFLAKGAEAAVSRHAADLSAPCTDVLVFATLRQYREAILVLVRQPWGLATIAKEMQKLLWTDGEKQDFC